MNEIRPTGMNMLTFNDAIALNVVNNLPSSKFTYQEDSKSIKNNARNTYKTQYRLVNASDFENYIKKNFSNLIRDVKVVNNERYVNEHLEYLNKIGLSEPNLDSRILFNQINFSNSCNFNNVNVYCIPKIPQNEVSNINKFLSIGLKNKIKSSINTIKILTSEIVFQDPVYMAFGLGVSSLEEVNNRNLYPEIIDETILKIKKKTQAFTSDSLMIENIVNIFKNYFDDQALGKKIDLEYLNGQLFSVNGVESFSTERTVNGQTISVNGISLLTYNPIYFAPEEDISIVTQSFVLPFFKAAYFSDYEKFKNSISIE
jgi:hypothetical protein